MYYAFAMLSLVLLLALPLSAQTDASEEQRLAKFKAVFIYNFIGYVKWPVAKAEGPLIVGILGESDVTPYLQRIVAKRKVGKRPIVIKVHQQAVDELASCHVLFVPSSFDKELETLQKKLAPAHVLLVGDAEGAAKRGANIGFTLIKGKLKFEINTKTLERADLYMSSHLLRLGLLVE